MASWSQCLHGPTHRRRKWLDPGGLRWIIWVGGRGDGDVLGNQFPRPREWSSWGWQVGNSLLAVPRLMAHILPRIPGCLVSISQERRDKAGQKSSYRFTDAENKAQTLPTLGQLTVIMTVTAAAVSWRSVLQQDASQMLLRRSLFKLLKVCMHSPTSQSR